MTDTQLPEALLIFGPTASGKSSLALDLAEHFDADIVAVDSVQVYRRFNIGSAKPSIKDQSTVAHHLIDLVDPHDSFDANKFAIIGKEIMNELKKRKRRVIVVAGTGLYLHALVAKNFSSGVKQNPLYREKLSKIPLEDLQLIFQKELPHLAVKIHQHDSVRMIRALEKHKFGEKKSDCGDASPLFQIPHNWKGIYLAPPKQTLWEQIERRSKKMLMDGLIEEVQGLLKAGVPEQSRPMQSIGYKQVVNFLESDSKDEDQLLENIVIATRQYAKRQNTWFRKLKTNAQVCEEISTADNPNFHQVCLNSLKQKLNSFFNF